MSPETAPSPTSDKPIFIIEDDTDVAQIVRRALEQYGFRVEHFRTGRELRQRLLRQEPDLCIVDLQLPDVDGMELVRDLQEKHDCGILILTGRQDVSDRVVGLEMGADDYVAKPFEPRELVARVRSILRRHVAAHSPSRQPHAVARFAGWVFDVDRYALTASDGSAIPLSAAEARLLLVLLENANRILTREQLMRNRDLAPFDRSVDVRISRLRQKIEADPRNPQLIKTVYGAGYLMSTSVTWD
jgi:two-component system OmpR family response regulator